MIHHIKNIGEYIKSKFPHESAVNGMVNTIESKDMKYILLINVLKDTIECTTKEFEEDIVYDALFYQAGRAAEGGGIRLDFYEDLNPKKEYKGRSKLKKACEFCEVDNRYEEIRDYVENYLKGKDKNTFAVIQVSGKMPRELFEEKFIKRMYAMTYNQLEGEHICHLCGKKGAGYNTTTYKFYTNDKEIYTNVEDKGKSGIIIGEECLNHMIIGKRYIEKYLTTYWRVIGKKVMFLPHQYDENVAYIYESSFEDDKKGEEKVITAIRLNEEDLIDEIGKTNTVTDILFYEDDSKFFYINHYIQSILPSRFSYIGNLFKKYDLKLYTILLYATAIKVSLDIIETTEKEKMRILDAIFTGRKINRNVFFKRIMDVYKYYFLKDEHKKYACMKSMNRVYNFLCDCNCLEKGWDTMKEYKNYEELFKNNKEYFDTNEKKAWFVLGQAYSKMIYLIKTKRKEEDSNDIDKTPLEKNFFFARKFDFNDFIYFSNLLTDKASKYTINQIYFKNMLCEAKEYMANREGKLSFDEAKYIFFWGIDAYFKIIKEESEEE